MYFVEIKPWLAAMPYMINKQYTLFKPDIEGMSTVEQRYLQKTKG